MPADSHRERVVAAIRISSQPLDGDQVAARAGISPRQTVNQICRALERAGMVRRRPGPDGKIVNEWLGDQDRDREPGSNPGQVSEAFPVTGALASTGTVQNAGAVPAGDSAEQRGAERVMLDLPGAQLGGELNPATITVPSGERVQVDGADAGRMVLAECWAHQGPPKSAQRHKVLADAFKLAWIATTLYPRPQLILCLSDPLAAAPAPSATTPVPLTTQAVSPPAATARNGKTSEGLTPERWNRRSGW
jgi:DprA winged helix domain